VTAITSGVFARAGVRSSGTRSATAIRGRPAPDDNHECWVDVPDGRPLRPGPAWRSVLAAPLTEARLNEPITRHPRQDFARPVVGQSVGEALAGRRHPPRGRIVYSYVTDLDGRLGGVWTGTPWSPACRG
jgi:hypothetical protein